MDSVQNAVVPLQLGQILSERNPFTLTGITQPTGKSKSQRVILVGRSSLKILYLSPLCQTLSKVFSTSRKQPLHVLLC